MHMVDDFGELDRDGSRLVLRFRRRLQHDRMKVWRALTEPDHLAAWFPTSIDGERVAGAPLQFVFPHNEGPTIEGEMLAFDPPALMEMRWGEELLRFELHADGEGTIVDFSNTFDELGKASRDAAGWHACLDLLECEAAGRAAPWESADRWRQVHPTYVERLGPDASTIGPPVEWEQVHGSIE
jgi:uncharacterized protein YndB with AHSA1/START domain